MPAERKLLDPREQHFLFPSPEKGLRLFLRYLPFRDGVITEGVVLYIHGATFPSALSIAHRFDGRSWRDELSAAGFDVWSLDFLGFGESDRYPAMAGAPDGVPALGRALDASRQIESAVRFIATFHQVDRISLIAHSWGTIATGCFASRCPELVERLVFFGPISKRSGDPALTPTFPAWRLITLHDQWDRFIADVPAGASPVLLRRHFDHWGELYLDSDAASRSRQPASVKVPCGPVQDIAAAWHGRLDYDPGLIQAPVVILRGEWDQVTNDADVAWLFSALSSSPVRRDVKISRGTHLMHLEESRYALYREAETFLLGRDKPGTDEVLARSRVA